MDIAVIGWGSLIWCPGSLRIKTKWRKDGPMLPIEFARKSDDGRLTLVIHPGSSRQRTYWAISEETGLGKARANLKEREGCPPNKIHYYPLAEGAPSISPEVSETMHVWLSDHRDVDAVIWTGLTANWEFSVDNAAGYLEKLEAEHKTAEMKLKRAKEYLINAPPSIQTEVRARMQEKGWVDAPLAKVLFEEEG